MKVPNRETKSIDETWLRVLSRSIDGALKLFATSKSIEDTTNAVAAFRIFYGAQAILKGAPGKLNQYQVDIGKSAAVV